MQNFGHRRHKKWRWASVTDEEMEKLYDKEEEVEEGVEVNRTNGEPADCSDVDKEPFDCSDVEIAADPASESPSQSSKKCQDENQVPSDLDRMSEGSMSQISSSADLHKALRVAAAAKVGQSAGKSQIAENGGLGRNSDRNAASNHRTTRLTESQVLKWAHCTYVSILLDILSPESDYAVLRQYLIISSYLNLKIAL